MWWNSSWAISNPGRWCCESAALNMPANLENSAVATGLAKVSFHSNAKECSNYRTIKFISHASKVMLKILQARLQQYVHHEIPDVQPGFRKKAEGPEIKLPASVGSLKNQEFQKKLVLLLYWLCQSLVWITINWGKFWKRWEYQTTWPASWETYMQVRKQQLQLDVEKQTGSK